MPTPIFQDTYELISPINDPDVDGSKIYQVTLQRPKVKHLKKVQSAKNAYEENILLASVLTGLALPQIEDLDQLDLEAIIDLINPFISKNFQK